MAIVAQLGWVLGFLLTVVVLLLAYAGAILLGIVRAERRFATSDAIAREQSGDRRQTGPGAACAKEEELIDGERRITL